MLQIFEYLKEHGISYERYDHPPVFNCEEAALHTSGLGGHHTKNLFLRDKKNSYYLLITYAEKRVNLKLLAAELGAVKFSFGSAEELKSNLGLEAGSVSALGLVNDTAHKVSLFIDQDIWDGGGIQCHPLVNTSTLIISRDDLARFFETSGHALRVITVPALE